MLFSVLLSLYHKESPLFLRQSLTSIFTQTLLPIEVVLVEDGPLTDELYAVIKEFTSQHPELKVISLPTNRGLGKALNEGLKHCSYDLEFEGEVSNVLSMRKVPEQHENILRFAKGRCPVNHPVVMFRKSAVLKAGGYKHFPLFEDYYLWVRMLMNGARFYNIQESLLFFRFSPDMFRRRGGWRYAVTEVRLQTLFYKMGFIGFFSLLKNVCIRLVTRLLPNGLRSLLYKRLIRG